MAFVLAVTWTAKAGNEARVREIHEAMGEASREVRLHPRHRRDAHQETEHFQRLVLQEAIPLLEARVRRQFVDF